MAKTMLINDFCEEFDAVNAEATICFIISNNKYDLNLKCRKKNIEFWDMPKAGLRFFIEGAEIGSHGVLFNIVTCLKEEDIISIDYIFYNNRGERVCSVSILKE